MNKGNIPRRIVIVSDMLQNSDAYTSFPRQVAIRDPVPNPPPASPPSGAGGPFIAPPAHPLPPLRPTVRYRTPPVKKLTPAEVEAMVERKGGLPRLKDFKPIVVHQIHGKYAEEKLQQARQFWDPIATQYGARIEWRRL
jgi:hypothetical protein